MQLVAPAHHALCDVKTAQAHHHQRMPQSGRPPAKPTLCYQQQLHPRWRHPCTLAAAQRYSLPQAVFEGLEGEWRFTRQARSSLPSAPNGTVTGTATLKVTQPGTPANGSMDTTAEQMLYRESGRLVLQPCGSVLRTRQAYMYVYEPQDGRLSVHFVRAGDQRDYLFHAFEFQDGSSPEPQTDSGIKPQMTNAADASLEADATGRTNRANQPGNGSYHVDLGNSSFSIDFGQGDKALLTVAPPFEHTGNGVYAVHAWGSIFVTRICTMHATASACLMESS